MRYYNEANTEKRIRRKAKFITFSIFVLFSTVGLFAFSSTAQELIPDTWKEWIFDKKESEDTAKESKKRA